VGGEPGYGTEGRKKQAGSQKRQRKQKDKTRRNFKERVGAQRAPRMVHAGKETIVSGREREQAYALSIRWEKPRRGGGRDHTTLHIPIGK